MAEGLSMNGRPAWLIAHELLWLRRDKATTPLQLIKLVFLCHGWMLAIHGRPLIREAVEAWKYGPVVPSVYHAFKSFGGEPITVEPLDMSEHLDAEEIATIERVDRSYVDYTGPELSAITHQKNTPWHRTKKAQGIGAEINDEIIREHYGRLLASTHGT